MMIPSVIAPPALYPGLYRPAAAAAALPLQHALPSVFPAHSSFLVEDLLRISRPAAFLSRTVPSSSASLPTATNTVSFSGANAVTHESCTPKTSLSSSKDPTFLKFGVSAILAPSPKSGESRLLVPPDSPVWDHFPRLIVIIIIISFNCLCFSCSDLRAACHPQPALQERPPPLL